MIGFGIDQIQAEYVAEIKLRNINKEYILKRVNETAALQDEIADLEDTLHIPRRLKKILVDELTEAARKYGEPRRTSIVYSHEIETYVEEAQVEDYSGPCVPLQGGVLQEDYPRLPADGGGPEVQGRGRIVPDL